MLGSGEESVKIEVGLREPLLIPSVRVEAQTLLLDPVSGTPLVSPLPVTCLSRSEAMAEKLRAALSRREAAVRDFYDVDHAVRLLEFQVRDTTLIELVKRKLAIPGNEPVDVSANRRGGARRTAGDGAFRRRTGTPASGWAGGWSVPAVRPSGWTSTIIEIVISEAQNEVRDFKEMGLRHHPSSPRDEDRVPDR